MNLSSSGPALEVVGLCCGYHGKAVLRDVALAASGGELITLLGPNGSGKSTLLKTINKALPAISGEVRLRGSALSGLDYRQIAQRVAFVPQEEYAFYPFTALQIVLMGRLPHSTSLLDRPEDFEIAENALIQADCAALRNRSILELSGGERQRVWIARALAQRAPILLLDEPSSHLDVAHQVSLLQLLKGLTSEGLTVLAAVHDLNFAGALSSRSILLMNGQIGKDGPTAEILSDPILEDAYHVRFERSISAKDTIRVFPY